MVMVNRRGFTIVELLIVVVVIAVLAAITIVAYNGIQKRAGTATYTAAVDGLEKQIRLAITSGALSSDTTFYQTCLGEAKDYPATGNFPAGSCLNMTSSPSSGVTLDISKVDMLRSAGVTIPSGLPMYEGNAMGDQSIWTRGIFLQHVNTSQLDQVVLVWFPADTSTCGRGVNSVEASIQQVKANPQLLADVEAQLGPDWENIYRSLTGGGACQVVININ